MANRIQTGTTGDIVSEFVNEWDQRQYFYIEAATKAHELCETQLASNAIRAIVTYRVKQGNRLEAKLRQRMKTGKSYQNANDIRDDIVDLAGVRIALYFPNDVDKVAKIIKDAFRLVKHLKFPNSDDKKHHEPERAIGFEQRFGGYLAEHYRVRMRVDNLATQKLRDTFRRQDPMIEIQVASVLMHAWAEIHHDLVYKTLTSGPASLDELRILDATNGLVHTGEVLLQQLQIAVDSRVLQQNETFSDQYQLVAYLRREQNLGDAPMNHMDVLLRVLKLMELDSPLKLSPHLNGSASKIVFNTEDPAALVVLEHVLKDIREEEPLESTPGTLGSDPGKSSDTRLTMIPRPLDEFMDTSYDDDFDTKQPRKLSDYILRTVRRQIGILERAVNVADTIVAPKKSMLVVEDTRPPLAQFHKLYSHLLGLKLLTKDEELSNRALLMIEHLDSLWDFFADNNNVLYRVALKLARLNVPDIVGILAQLHPSAEFQRIDYLQPEVELLDIREHEPIRRDSRKGRMYSAPSY